jgi:hypothetical protein
MATDFSVARQRPQLRQRDHDAIVLRFMENKDFKQIATALGIKEDAAKMRVHRALEKLRHFFVKRGVVASAAVIAGAVSANSIHAAPIAVTNAAIAAGLTHGTVASGSTLALAHGTFKFAAWTKLTTALATGAVILAAGTAGTILFSNSNAELDLPAATWKFAGYGTPAAAVETLAFSARRGDGATVLASLSPACQQEFREVVAQAKRGGVSVEKFFAQTLGPQFKDRTGIRILKTEVLWTNQVLLDVALRGGKKGHDQWLKVCLFGDEWKIDDFDPKGSNSRTGMGHPNATYGGVGMAVVRDEKTHEVTISNILSNSPAARVGLSTGLFVRSINGTATAGKSLSECVFLCRGRSGTSVLLGVVDPRTSETNMVEVIRQKFVR